MAGGRSKGRANASSTTAETTANGNNGPPGPTTAPSRTSRRQRHASPDFELDPKSAIAKQLASNLIVNPEETKKRREKNFAPGDKWTWETVGAERVDSASEATNEGEEQQEEDDKSEESLQKSPQMTSDGRKRGQKRKASQQDPSPARSSKGPKVPRVESQAGDQQQNDTPPADELAGNGAGNEGTPPDDGDDSGDDLASADRAPAPEQTPARNADEKFLRDCLQQFKSQKPRKGSGREFHIRTALAILRRARQPCEDRTQFFANISAEEDGDKPDFYLLDSSEAKRLLESDVEITAPVFVSHGAREGLFTGSMARPIERFLNTWLLDENEQLNVTKSAKAPGIKALKIVAKLRRHFLENERQRLHPWNLPDILNPRPEHCLPHFVQSLNCNLLRDVARRALDATADEICPEICPDAHGDRLGCSNERHKLTRKEYHKLMEGWEHWPGTAMLADPGAITTSHWDNWGLGTWISCHEGQIGVTWRSHPTDKEISAYLLQEPKAHTMGTTLYKVMRPGDALYMPPGTIHNVFRRPSGNQTLAFAGHILRRASLVQWLRILQWETGDVETNWGVMKGSSHEHIVPPLARAIRAVVGERGEEDRANSFGARANFQLGENQVRALEAAAGRLQRRAFISPYSSREPSPEQQDEPDEEVQVTTNRGKKPNKKKSKSANTRKRRKK